VIDDSDAVINLSIDDGAALFNRQAVNVKSIRYRGRF
jgi:hypothetical protein